MVCASPSSISDSSPSFPLRAEGKAARAEGQPRIGPGFGLAPARRSRRQSRLWRPGRRGARPRRPQRPVPWSTRFPGRTDLRPGSGWKGATGRASWVPPGPLDIYAHARPPRDAGRGTAGAPERRGLLAGAEGSAAQRDGAGRTGVVFRAAGHRGGPEAGREAGSSSIAALTRAEAERSFNETWREAEERPASESISL